MRIGFGLGVVAAAVMLLSGCQSRPAVHGQGSVAMHDGRTHTHVGVVFSDSDRHHIHNYYRERYHYYYGAKKHKGRKGLPPGLAKRQQLPPGLAKHDRLPPGLYGYRLPHELDRRLSRTPAGVIRVRIGTSIVLMDESTRVVLDVIKDIPLD